LTDVNLYNNESVRAQGGLKKRGGRDNPLFGTSRGREARDKERTSREGAKMSFVKLVGGKRGVGDTKTTRIDRTEEKGVRLRKDAPGLYAGAEVYCGEGEKK